MSPLARVVRAHRGGRAGSFGQPGRRRQAAAILVALVSGAILAAMPRVQMQASGTKERLRGVSAMTDRVAWASGARGTVLRTIDDGSTWTAVRVPGAEGLDFRDVEAFDADLAYVLSIGSGDRSRIFKTTDGGRTWSPQFTNTDPKAFYDDIAFWDARTGIAVGDPVDGRYTFIRTTDGGETWTPVSPAAIPPALVGEGAFAASGSCLVVQGTKNAWLGTGGASRARVFRSTDQGLSWTVADTPIAAATSSAGIFSIAFADAVHGVVVGGDYRKEPEPGDNLAATSDGGRTWTLVGSTRLRGFRSGVVFVPGTGGRSLIAVGPAGADWSADAGVTWTPIGQDGFDSVRVTRSGRVAWATGAGGRIGRIDGLR